MRFVPERMAAFAGGFMSLIAMFFALWGLLAPALLLWLLGLSSFSFLVARLSRLYEKPEMGEKMREGTFMLALSLLPAYAAGYAELSARPYALLAQIHLVPDLISTATMPQLSAIILFHILSVVSSLMISSALFEFSRLSGEASYRLAALLLAAAVATLSPLLAFLGLGVTLLLTSVYGRLRVP
ncbi:MAG: hypothetical protein N3F67_03405 [Acidilobaceae archaeon]|nr:hypothetical protein [Acidilobaceae archaeon]